MRFLILGDIVGKIGRTALSQELPALQSDVGADFTIVQAENLAHGKGITEKTINEMRDLKINCFTGGNHTFSKPGGIHLLQDSDLLRPANYSNQELGVGYRIFTVGDEQAIVLNLQGEVGMKETVDSPFTVADRILSDPALAHIPIRLVDFHGEATSERVACGWFLDGRVSLMWGTHTHVQTNDARILPQGTGYITDIGMVGLRNGVIGIDRDVIIHNFINSDQRRSHEIPDSGEAIISGIVADISSEGTCTHIETINIVTEVFA